MYIDISKCWPLTVPVSSAASKSRPDGIGEIRIVLLDVHRMLTPLQHRMLEHFRRLRVRACVGGWVLGHGAVAEIDSGNTLLVLRGKRCHKSVYVRGTPPKA